MPKKSPSDGVTLRDIASFLGISHVTVSRALHDSPLVTPVRREQIKEVAYQMGYRPNPMAVALGIHRQTTAHHTVTAEIAWLNYWKEPERLRSFREFDLYWQGAYAAAERRGYRLEEFICRDMPPDRLEKILLARNIQGILIPPNHHDDRPPFWERIHWEKFSAIRFGYSVVSPAVHIVAVNQVTSIFIALDNMKRLGYRRVGFVTHHGSTMRDRAGFLMRQQDIPDNQRIPVLTMPPKGDLAAQSRALTQWMEQHRPDAILTGEAELKEMLQRVGYEVPRDVGMAAFSVLDGNVDAGLCQNSLKIGEAAADSLISLINRSAYGIPSTKWEILIEADWVDGLSLPAKT